MFPDPLVDQDGAATEQITMSLKRHVDGSVEQRMSGADERCQWLTTEPPATFRKRSFIARENWLADADEAIPVANGAGTLVISKRRVRAS